MTVSIVTRPSAKGRKTAWPAVLHRIVGTVRRRALLEQGQHVLVAVSGGPDSVALLSLLQRLSSSWELTLTAAHFNYGLRGSESDGDEAFVSSLCRDLQVPLHVRNLSMGRRPRGTSLQAVARALRYDALKELARTCGADRIAVGHTADDQAETVLLWILRGAGLSGLSGMPPSREGTIVRPLYDVSRQEILAYLGQEGLRYREDASNAKPIYVRNRIRHEVLPVLKDIVPSIVRMLCRLGDLCREDERYLDEVVVALCTKELHQDSDRGWSVGRKFFLALPLPLQRRVIRETLRRCDALCRPPSSTTVVRVVDACASGRAMEADLKGVRLVVTKERIRFSPVRQSKMVQNGPFEPKALAVPSTVTWAGTGQYLCVQRVAEGQGLDRPRHGGQRIVLDADRFSGPLMVRAWKPGDRFCPLGMGGRFKKVQDFFTDLKVPIEVRATIPILAAPEGIVWIVGYRQDERFAVRDSTQHRVVVSVTNQPSVEGAC